MVSLCVSKHLLLHFKHDTTALQGYDVDIVTGYTVIKTVKETLSNVSWIQFDFGKSMRSPTPLMHDLPNEDNLLSMFYFMFVNFNTN